MHAGPEDDNAVSLDYLDFVAFSPFSRSRNHSAELSGDHVDLDSSELSQSDSSIVDVKQFGKSHLHSNSMS